MTAFSSPLIWPPEVPRHVGERSWGPFLRTVTSTVVHDLEDELRRMGATNIAVTTNVRVGRIGRPDHELLARDLPDPGVAIYLHRKGRDLVFALDRFQSPKSNLRALTLALDAIRTIERYGGAGMEDRALAGFTALPANAGTTVTHWSIVLGIAEEFERFTRAQPMPSETRAVQRAALLVQVEGRFKELAREHHSDVAGGGHEAMVELNRARDEARKELAS